MDALPNVLLISLKQAEDRRAGAIKALERLGLKYQWIKAVDGAALDHKAYQKSYQVKNTMRFYSNPLGKGEVGCYLSHLECYRTIVKQNLPYALVMEDDMRPSSELLKVLNCRHQFPKDWEIINLWPRQPRKHMPSNAFSRDNIHYRQRLFGEHYIGKYFYLCYHTHLYLITQQYAREMLSYLQPICMPIDIALFDIGFSKNFPYAVYKIVNNKFTVADTGTLSGGSQIATMDNNLRNFRQPIGLKRGSRTWRKIKRIIARLGGLWCLNILIKIACILPWNDQNKLNILNMSYHPNLLSRTYTLLHACRWKCLLPACARYAQKRLSVLSKS